jgi:predicted Zn-dependent protease
MGASVIWEQALEDALAQLGTVLPITRTHLPSKGNIFIDLIRTEQFPYRAPCDEQHNDACSRMLPMGDPASSNFTLLSRIWIRETTPIPAEHILLHELMHALGLLIHSPHPDDVLYNGADSTPVILSERDRTTLTYLYAQPAIGELTH